MNRTEQDISFNRILIYLMILIPFFDIPYLTTISPGINRLYDLWMVLSGCIIIVLIIKKKTYSKIINNIIVLLSILIISSILNSTNIAFCLKNVLRILSLCLVVDNGVRTDSKNFFKAFSILLSILVYLNFFSIVFYRNGMYRNETGYIENWILGYKNSHILYILPAILTSFISSYQQKNKFTLSNYFLLIISAISTIIVNNSTGLIGLGIIIIFLIFKKVFNKIKLLNIINYTIVYVTLFLSIIIFRIQNIFSYFIVNVLKKDITFTGRTYIWDKAINYIRMQPLLGYGNTSFQYNIHIYSTHNAILGIMHKVGIIGLIAYISIIFKSIKQLYINKTSELSRFISIVIFSYFTMMLTEAYALEYYLFIFVIAYNISYLIKKEKKNEKNITS